MSTLKKYKNDMILIAFILLVGIVLWGIFMTLSKDGKNVIVTIDGEQYGKYPMDKDAEIDIKGPNGEYNHLAISGGKAKMTEADCRDKICMHMAPLERSGQSIVCLPNKVVVTIVGNDDDEEDIDAITGL